SPAIAVPSNQPLETEQEGGMKVTSEALKVAQGEITDVVINARKTFQKFTTGDKPLIPESALHGAQCAIVFPEVTRVAVVVGGQHGDGVATCRGADDKWSGIGFVDLRGASIGAQLGVKSSSVVVLLNNQNAAEQLKKGKMRFAADVSYAFNNQGAEKEMATDKTTDVKVYSDTGGAFASASLKGSYIVADDEEIQKFYKDEVKTLYAALSAVPAENSTAEVKELLVLLPSESSAS
ncbi:MAG: lipid-binding SYLF domain-containing protein, partial [Bdellovibrionales bacterium]|nr:lipid-binding SYLF domain-containing protein [Bdellovibrionales bacterium]